MSGEGARMRRAERQGKPLDFRLPGGKILWLKEPRELGGGNRTPVLGVDSRVSRRLRQHWLEGDDGRP